jgi:hypothetical protein
MNSFDQAFNSLLSMAPGPLFPRARQLYLRKYSLEGQDGPQRFRTFLYQEQVEEQPEGLVRVRALAFAVVHWQAPQTIPDDYATYLQQRWQLEPSCLGLELEDGSWFRDGGAFARFQAPALYERPPSGALLLDGS